MQTIQERIKEDFKDANKEGKIIYSEHTFTVILHKKGDYIEIIYETRNGRKACADDNEEDEFFWVP